MAGRQGRVRSTYLAESTLADDLDSLEVIQPEFGALQAQEGRLCPSQLFHLPSPATLIKRWILNKPPLELLPPETQRNQRIISIQDPTGLKHGLLVCGGCLAARLATTSVGRGVAERPERGN